MLSFESGVSYLRKEARKAGLIADSDNNDVLIEKVAGLIRKSKSAPSPVVEFLPPNAQGPVAKKAGKKKVSKKAA